MSDIARQLRALRERHGLRLADVATMVGISATYLSDIEHGRRATIDSTLATLNKVLAVYGMEAVVEIRVKHS